MVYFIDFYLITNYRQLVSGKGSNVIWRDVIHDQLPVKYQVKDGIRNNKWEGCVSHPEGYVYIAETRKGIFRYNIKRIL